MGRSGDSIVVSGALARRPAHGGHAWVFLHWILGFAQLGFDVTFVDRLEPELCVDESGRNCPPQHSVNWRYLSDTLAACGLRGCFALLVGDSTLGMSRAEVSRRIADATALFNVNGYLQDEDLTGSARRRVFVDIDPGFGQMWYELGLVDLFSHHDAFVTVATNLGQPDCLVPTAGLDWVTTLPPVVLDHWPARPAGHSKLTSVMTWRGPFDSVTYQQRRFGLRVHEFRRFIDLPTLTKAEFELALRIDPADHRDRARLAARGWGLVDPGEVADTTRRYRRYIQESWAEFQVAKNIYVDSASGWFSDRSACYLASAKPVLAQDTGLSRVLPAGEGLVTFGTLDEAITGVEDLLHRYEQHRRAARRLAESHLDARIVLSNLLTALNIDHEPARTGDADGLSIPGIRHGI